MTTIALKNKWPQSRRHSGAGPIHSGSSIHPHSGGGKLHDSDPGNNDINREAVTSDSAESRAGSAAAAARRVSPVRYALFLIAEAVLTFLASFFVFCSSWAFHLWSNLTMEEIVFELTSPLQGTGSSMLSSFVKGALLPPIMITAAVLVVTIVFRKRENTAHIVHWLMIACGAVMAGAFLYAWHHLKVTDYLTNRGTSSTFIEDNYVDPSKAAITFPEKKRNLVYIWLESMEDTYSDEDNGGGFTFNCIPELTQLAEQNEDFSGSGASGSISSLSTDKDAESGSGVTSDTSKLNGGYAMTGATWTMGGLFAQTSGLPLQTQIGNNGMQSQKVFFPSITTLGDILKKEGYHNVFMCGSDATFGGRKLYFTEHGGYDVYDYNYAVENGWIPKNYKVWWGFEDEKLISFAKKKLTELGSSSEPFNFSMLTVDTHFPDGYVCRLCPDTFGSNQYANVMACSSKQISELVSWIQQQDWYENTTIVISGDHLTMDGDFCSDVSSDYQRKVYTCYINAPVTAVSTGKPRVYTTFDDFPTTLAALGCTIDGNRLGLGTNLFSDTPTLLETNDLQTVNTELARKSEFMEKNSGIDENVVKIADTLKDSKPKISVNPLQNVVTFTVSNVDNINSMIRHLYVSAFNKDGERMFLKSAKKNADGTWSLTVDQKLLQGNTRFTVKLHVDSEAGDIYIENGRREKL